MKSNLQLALESLYSGTLAFLAFAAAVCVVKMFV
jgi:hypothetical protein